MAKLKQYVDKRNNKKMWMFDGYIAKDPITRKEFTTTRKGFKTKKEAQMALDTLKLQILQKEKVETTITFKELYELWLPYHRSEVKESTLATSRRFVEGHVLPYLGDKRVNEITVAYCQSIVNKWYEKDTMYIRYRRITGQIMKFGIAMEIMEKNPMSSTILRKRKDVEKKIQFYTKEELEYFFECAYEHGNDKQYVFFRTLAFTGCRKSEVLALQWRDIDFENREIDINKTLALGENERILIQTPKTTTSKRLISIDEKTIEILKFWRNVQLENYKRVGLDTSSENQYVFTNLKNKLYYPQVVNDWLDYLIKKYTLVRITPHHFRHTHASLLIHAGVPLPEVAERLGHKKDSKTLLQIYTHCMPEEIKKTGEKFAKFVNF
ncbi:site-specific integrase [Enterococcus faecalis]|nr:site-specific integrase [Enterococcus faecalis]